MVARGLTWVEGWLESGESVILQHVQKRLLGILVSMRRMFLGNQTSSRSFRRYQARGKGSSRFYAKDLLRCGSVVGNHRGRWEETAAYLAEQGYPRTKSE